MTSTTTRSKFLVALLHEALNFKKGQPNEMV